MGKSKNLENYEIRTICQDGLMWLEGPRGGEYYTSLGKLLDQCSELDKKDRRYVQRQRIIRNARRRLNQNSERLARNNQLQFEYTENRPRWSD